MLKVLLDAEEEYSECEERIGEIRHMMCVIEEDMPEDVCEEGKKSPFGRVYDLLWKCELTLMGRMNELEPDYCAEYEREYSMSKLYRKEAELARENGVNFVALWEHVPGAERKAEAIAYIVVNGLASLNYEATCVAIEQYESDRQMRLTA
ncbi:MAG: hypothetical protein II876_04795 [Synergistaceae bacterium]|nr:hypothetical protein [Synergistaceae bacterium]MBQ3758762.1 hypothetical protein [Synergistaceae bacterium]